MKTFGGTLFSRVSPSARINSSQGGRRRPQFGRGHGLAPGERVDRAAPTGYGPLGSSGQTGAAAGQGDVGIGEESLQVA